MSVGCPWCGASSNEECIDQQTQQDMGADVHPERIQRALTVPRP